MSQSENQQELSPEQIAEYKKATLAFYKERMAFLKTQREYEVLCADIEEAKLRALIARIKYAQITSPELESEEEEEETKKEE